MNELGKTIFVLHILSELRIRSIAEEIALASNGKLTIADVEKMVRDHDRQQHLKIPPTLESFKPLDRTWLLFG